MSVQLEFLGAAGTVTGSRTLLRKGNKNILVDCGLFQGPKEIRDLNWQSFEPKPSEISDVILTHAHLDHSGYLPKLYKEGFRGLVHCTQGTKDVCEVLLKDAAHLQKEDADYANKTGYSNHKPALPLYTTVDVDNVLKRFRVHPRNEWVEYDTGLSLRFARSGHIVGSSFVQLQFPSEGGEKRLITFSGDLGHHRSLTLKGPISLPELGVLVMESTYGSRPHDRTDVGDSLAKVIQKIVQQKGVLLIPAFAVGRTQEILYLIRKLENEKKIPSIPVVLDSPMGSAITTIFLNHVEDNLLSSSFSGSGDQFFPEGFTATTSIDESMMTCMQAGPLIVIAGAGMCNGGRILHHLKARLPSENNMVLFVGYQSEGTKGRFLQEKGKAFGTVRIHHKEVEVNAELVTMQNLSAHGDAQDIIEWIQSCDQKPKRILLNHGTLESSTELAKTLKSTLQVDTEVALSKTKYLLW